MDLEQLPATPADARGLTIELVEGPGSAPGLAIRKWTNHGLVAGTHHLVAPSRAALSAPPAGDAAVAWRALTEIADRPLIKEPKQGDYGKDRERCPSCGHAWHVDETPHHAPACDRMIAVAARREMAFATHPTPTTPEGLREKAWADVRAERLRQIEAEGWTVEHDDQHGDGSIAAAAACYAMFASVSDASRAATTLPASLTKKGADIPGWSAWLGIWPWNRSWWKPKDRRHDLVRAAALLIAEIERLDRLAGLQPQGGEG